MQKVALPLMLIRGTPHRLFFYFLICVALWGIVIFGMRSSPDVQHAYYWEKGLIPLSPLLPVIFYHFSLRYTGARINRKYIIYLYVFCVLFSTLAFTDLVIKGMQIKYYGYAPIIGPLAPLWFISTYVIYWLVLLKFIKSRKASRYPEQRNRYSYIIIGILMTFIGGFLDILPAFGLPSYPGLIIGTLIFILLTTIAVVKYQLLDINLVIKKSAVYLLTSIVIAAPFIAIFLLAISLIPNRDLPFIVYGVTFILLALLLPQFWQLVQKRIDKLFYRERYNYLKALGGFNLSTYSLLDKQSLYEKIGKLIQNVIEAENVYIFQAIGSDAHFELVSSTRENSFRENTFIHSNSPLVKWLEHNESILYATDIEIIPQLQSLNPDARELMANLGVEALIPIKSGNKKLQGVLVLTKKLSDKLYTVEDEQLLLTLTAQLAMKLENSRLYEETLQAREALEMWLDTMSDGVLIIDSDGRIQFANRAASDKLGAKQGEVFRYSPFNNNNLGESTASKQLSYTTEIFSRDYDVAVAPLLDTTGATVFVQVFRDITEKKLAAEKEQALQQELYLSSRLASIGQLAAGVAHEINNPLTGILGFSERLLRRSSDESAIRDLGRIYGEAKRAAKVVENLRAFAHRWEPHKEQANINNIVEKAIELRAYELDKSNVKLELDLDPCIHDTYVDFYQIQQVFINIILNSEQAMVQTNGGGLLKVKTAMTDDAIKITFMDNGPGIPQEYIDKIFDPFFTTHDRDGGTGLGLSICHGIITAHEGKISVSNSPGGGAFFSIELPNGYA